MDNGPTDDRRRTTNHRIPSRASLLSHSPYHFRTQLLGPSPPCRTLSTIFSTHDDNDGSDIIERQSRRTAVMSSVIHGSKPRVASFYSQVSHATFAMSDVSLQVEAMMEEDEEEDDSPYGEVRASVSNMDDPDMPVLTFRMWVIGIFLNIASAAVNTFFNFRNPQIYVISLPVLYVQRASPSATHPRKRETLTLRVCSSICYID